MLKIAQTDSFIKRSHMNMDAKSAPAHLAKSDILFILDRINRIFRIFLFVNFQMKLTNPNQPMAGKNYLITTTKAI